VRKLNDEQYRLFRLWKSHLEVIIEIAAQIAVLESEKELAEQKCKELLGKFAESIKEECIARINEAPRRPNDRDELFERRTRIKEGEQE